MGNCLRRPAVEERPTSAGVTPAQAQATPGPPPPVLEGARATLADAKYETTPESLVDNRRFVGRLVDVYDADTLTCIVEVVPGQFQRVTTRLVGVDACEMTSKDQAARDLAVRARDRVVEHLTHGAVRPAGAKRLDVRALLQADVFRVELDLYGREKYGRQLGKVFPVDADGVVSRASASRMLLDERLAVPYNGKGARLDEAAMIAALSAGPSGSPAVVAPSNPDVVCVVDDLTVWKGVN